MTASIIHFAIKQLHPVDLPTIMALQKTVYDGLKPEDKNFIIPKTEAQFLERMTTKGIMFGYFDYTLPDGNMVAYSALALPSHDWPVADMIFEPNELPCTPPTLGVLQNSVVLPSHRNMKIHQHLILIREMTSVMKNRPHIMTEIAAANPASLKGFLNFGYHVMQAGIDPDDGCQLLYVYKNEAKKMTTPSASTISLHPADPKDFKKLGVLLKTGYKGVSITKSQGIGGYLLHLAPTL